ncbi:MAG: [FeFe] hydrogenase H-cluster maturation GTPase HydF [Sedimentisphaerales bacterium]|nr:[FeFe] hydrogenase H-cluster maturation GTPase HydF [Sedimentisphaerales bacterium]
MKNTPKGLRLHIGLFGRRNVGKSSLLNALTRQQVSIISEVAGTTTDPVEKPMELLPLGPVLFIDTAGIDDLGSLGAQRVQRTRQVFDRTDLAILITQAGEWTQYEPAMLAEFGQRGIPTIVVYNKSDLAGPSAELSGRLEQQGIATVRTSALLGEGIADLLAMIIRQAPEDFVHPPTILGDLIEPGDLVMLVVPIDLEAPKGRLILPQVQTLREVLDGDACGLIVKERELSEALDRLRRPPRLVVTDSQAFLKVAGDTPPGVKMTSFSILFARQKGDLAEFVRGALAIERLRPGDRILISESCSHHPIGDDIGRIKIPRWLTQYVGGRLHFEVVQGHDFADDLADFRLVVQCGGCMHNRREMLTRIGRCRAAGVPITNYGVAIAYTLGILDRALEPFAAAHELYRRLRAK